MTGERLSWDVLQKIPIFRNFNETECHQIADIASVEHYAAGEIILKQGDASQDLWVVLDGNCEVVKFKEDGHAPRRSLTLAVLEPYSHFGEMSFFHPAPHSANVRAPLK